MDPVFLSRTSLFEGISDSEIPGILRCLQARERTFQKEETIYRAGSPVREVGLVESGSVNIVVNSYGGNSRIFGKNI